MADFNFDELRGAFARRDIIDPGEDSNYKRLLMKTAERLMNTELFRLGFVAQDPSSSVISVEYPYFAVYPAALPETERSNVANLKTYSALILMSLVDENPFRGVCRILAVNEKAEDACRTKQLIPLRDGDLHENTLLDTTPYVMAEGTGGQMMFSTGFRVRYEVTEPRREE